MEKLRAELEAQHQASLSQMKALWGKEKETEIQLQTTAQVALAKAAWKEELLGVCSFLPLLIPLNFPLAPEDFPFPHRWRRPGLDGWRRREERSAERPQRRPVRRPAGARLPRRSWTAGSEPRKSSCTWKRTRSNTKLWRKPGNRPRGSCIRNTWRTWPSRRAVAAGRCALVVAWAGPPQGPRMCLCVSGGRCSHTSVSSLDRGFGFITGISSLAPEREREVGRAAQRAHRTAGRSLLPLGV